MARSKDDGDNHHYVAKFYLKGFWKNYQLAYYERDSKTAGEDHPDRLASGPNFYERVHRNGVKDLDAEVELGKVENHAARVIKRLSEKKSITPQQRFSLSEFMAISYTRTPDHIETLKHLRERYQEIALEKKFASEEMVLEDTRLIHPDYDEERLKNLAHRIYVKMHSQPLFENTNIAVESMIKAKAITPYLFHREWRVIDAEPGQHFITTDSPLIPLWEEDRSLKDFKEASFVAFPLSQKQLIFMRGLHPSIHYNPSPENWTERLNIELATQSKNYLFGPEKSELLRIKNKINLDNVKWEPKKSFADIIFDKNNPSRPWPPPEL